MREMVYGTRCATPGEDLFALFIPFYADCICIIDRVIIYYETFDTIFRQRQDGITNHISFGFLAYGN